MNLANVFFFLNIKFNTLKQKALSVLMISLFGDYSLYTGRVHVFSKIINFISLFLNCKTFDVLLNINIYGY